LDTGEEVHLLPQALTIERAQQVIDNPDGRLNLGLE
jgi:hypothetical protein